MKIAHLILAHSQPAQLERLIDSLQHENAYFFIHIDQKATESNFDFLAARDRVFLISNREKVFWGAYSMVQATLNGFLAIARSGLQIDLVNLLSGSDYPLKSAEEIHDFFEKNPDKNFMEYKFIPEEWREAETRFTEYHLTNYRFRGKTMLQRWMNKFLPVRKMPDLLVPVGKSQWLSITMEAVQFIITYLDEHPEVVRFFKLTWAPDEMIFQTILYNSTFRSKLINNNLRYIDWSAGNASPKTLDYEDVGKLLASPALFARKFDLVKYPEILDMLDKRIHSHL
ncbi:beta-1,6-N-acetylglucosaminyltransferase [Dyadobacter sediminis]|uniref:Peptide O-xylosyltransferase n=1 Tax=Dyadobacter sediminis TaxID=1493691 RepID=A0A5R9KFM3_9BACT|nr:beta-1,6-N-acetylglucosaminyltransferase [Dyadobacter sediminis]TLU94887.1 glycosyl transferase [Dyadobacter sediminis]GGB87096.1 glycosyl transferase [Dyadobacter sediminis]